MAQARVQRIEYAGQAAWRKRYGATARRVRLALLRCLARWLGANALIAPLPRSARAACATERRMLSRLRQLGASVPEVLGASDTELILSDLGPTLAERCRAEATSERRAELVRRGFEALAELHRRNGYLSQAFARNMVCDSGRIGFIDFEDDPLEVMSLPAAQARDVLLYVHSTARFLADAEACFGALLERHLATESAAVRLEIARAVSRLAWLAPVAGWCGRRARDVGLALRVLSRTSLLLLAVWIGLELGDEAVMLADLALDALP